MPTPIVTAFSTGEISPLMRGRVDIDKYPYAGEEFTNMVITPLGASTKCPGTAYVATTKTDGKAAIFIPVRYSSIASYILEVGEYYIRIYSSNAQLTFDSAAYELVTPFTEADLATLRFVQSIDIIYLVNTNWLLQLQRFDILMWGLTTHRLQDGPYNDVNTTAITLTAGVAVGASHAIRDIAYGATKYITCGDGYIYSSDDGIVWTEEVNSLNFKTVKFLNSTFIAVGAGGIIYTSTDGTTWSIRVSGVATTLYDVAFLNSTTYVVVGASGTILKSTDLATWTTVVVAGLTVDLYGVTLVSAAIGVCVGAGKYAYTTNAGSAWTVGTTPDSVTFKSTRYNATYDRIYAGGDDGTIYYTSVITSGFTDQVACPISVHVNRLLNTNIFTYGFANDGYVICIANSNATIQQITRFDPTKHIYGACVGASNYLWAVGTDGMIWNGATAIPTLTPWPFHNIKEHNIVTKTLTATDDIFYSSDIGKLIRVKGETPAATGVTGNWGWGTIQKFTSKKVVVIDERSEIAGVVATVEWRIGTFFANGGYPSVIDIHEQRLIFGKNQTRWGSWSGDFVNFAPTELDGTVLDSSATTDVIGSGERDEILWMKSSDIQLIGTSGGIWRGSGTTIDSPITPTDKIYKKQAADGCEDVEPEFAGSTILYVQEHGRKIGELFYNFDLNTYLSIDLAKLAPHITKGGITKIAWQKEPHGILWCRRDDGVLVGLTYDKIQKFVAWWKRKFEDGDTEVEDICIIPGTVQDQLWLLFKITVGATVKRHICYMKDFDFDSEEIDFDEETADLDHDAFFVDDGITYSGASTVTIPVAHLIGKEVAVFADGVVQANKTVAAGGNITIATAAVKVQAGLPYTPRQKSVDLEVAAQRGTSQGKIKRITEIGIRVHESGTFKYGSAWDKMDTYTVADGKVVTKDVIKTLPSGYKGKAYIYIEGVGATPLTIVALMPKLEINER